MIEGSYRREEFNRLIQTDSLVRAHFEAWRNGHYLSFENMLIDLAISQSLVREILAKALVRAEQLRPSVFYVSGNTMHPEKE